ncbi:MAG TPA: hypothetical protein VGE79_12410, partial [Niastella sp.]
TVNYSLGTLGKKSIVFKDKVIEVTIQHTGTFTEYIPLLLGQTDSIEIVSPGKAILKKQDGDITILFDEAAKASLKKMTNKVGKQQVTTLVIESNDNLKYSFNMN